MTLVRFSCGACRTSRVAQAATIGVWDDKADIPCPKCGQITWATVTTEQAALMILKGATPVLTKRSIDGGIDATYRYLEEQTS